MKAVILAGGFGTRLSEETDLRPKPMIEIGGKPIIWHIMKTYSHYGVHEFIVCLGYKGYIVKEYFTNYFHHTSDITVNTRTGDIKIHRQATEDWQVSLIETGLNTMTGGRLKRVRAFLDDEDFFMTYGDGVSDVDIERLLAFHRKEGRLATVSAVRPPGRFGALEIADGSVTAFHEKPQGDNAYINGGFFVLSPKVLDYVEGDDTVWEREPMERLAMEGELSAYHHEGFWQPMDTLRDRTQLEALWAAGKAKWKVW